MLHWEMSIDGTRCDLEKITKSVNFRLKEKRKTILANTNDRTKNKYTRKAEKNLEPFEEHIKVKIAEKLESSDSFHWTYLLLQSLAVTERAKESFNQCDEIQKMSSGSRYWEKFLIRKVLFFKIINRTTIHAIFWDRYQACEKKLQST